MSTSVYVENTPVAVRVGRKGGAVVEMQVTEREWEMYADLPAYVEGENPEAPTKTAAECVESLGCAVVWKSAADWNNEARALRESRHAGMLGGLEREMSARAAETLRSSLRVV